VVVDGKKKTGQFPRWEIHGLHMLLQNPADEVKSDIDEW
jgi:hypothetical protein